MGHQRPVNIGEIVLWFLRSFLSSPRHQVHLAGSGHLHCFLSRAPTLSGEPKQLTLSLSALLKWQINHKFQEEGEE